LPSSRQDRQGKNKEHARGKKVLMRVSRFWTPSDCTSFYRPLLDRSVTGEVRRQSRHLPENYHLTPANIVMAKAAKNGSSRTGIRMTQFYAKIAQLNQQ
jgi:hypothetical protein